jgi:2,5-dioxopentanoate dehydrogenase
LIETVMEETHLPEGRIRGEKDRTIGQLAKFAQLVEEGSWVEATIDTGDAHRLPAPKPDLRKMLVPIGPVVVFGAGNFPLAFSVAGGDTASALAGGNPVIVKGHPSHPRTGKLVAKAICSAVQKQNLPEGTFQFIDAPSYESGQLLVMHPATKAVGFTGSEQGGRTLFNLAAQREEPIPVFAEMGSINPVVILEQAMAQLHHEIAAKLVTSVAMGAGQFCTNPGLIVAKRTNGFDQFVAELSEQVKAVAGAKMFSENVLRNYRENSALMLSHREVSQISKDANSDLNEYVVPVLAQVNATDFIKKPTLHKEVFGPFSLLVVCSNDAELKQVIASLKGQLTTTLFATTDELKQKRELIDELTQKCGRLLLNGVPTGVEVCAAMHHGGPYPATTDSRFTSVGVTAIKRFVRPVAFQDFLDELLPVELQNSNPLGIWRTINNQLTTQNI